MPPWQGWLPSLILPASIVVFTPAACPRWAFMWLLALSVFAGCKWLTWRRRSVPALPLWQHVAYLLAWPGLDADSFLQHPHPSADFLPKKSDWLRGGYSIFLGASLFWASHELIRDPEALVLGWCGMAGIVLMLHFGLFQLLSCFWRTLGVDARPIMNRPLQATSIGEFWGSRWNTAFRDFVHRFLFRPLKRIWGVHWAILFVFLFSGLVHDLVISVPAGAGYGFPTLFFLLQALALLCERSPIGKALGLGHGYRGRLFTLAALALPAPALCHEAFVRRVVLPFMNVLGAA